MLDHALRYAGKGLHVLPVYWPEKSGCGCRRRNCTSPAKHPLLEHGVKGASTDPEKLRYWWRIWPEANVAIATGRGVAVLDVDDLSVVDPVRLHTRVATTGRGLHAYYRVDRAVQNRTRVRPGVDIRGEGGYVLAPPSLHITGITYTWLHDTPMASAPVWFYELLKKPKNDQKYAGPPKVFELDWVKPIAEGGRNDRLYKIACRAVDKQKDAATIEAEIKWINQNRCTPPLPDREVELLLRSALRYLC